MRFAIFGAVVGFAIPFVLFLPTGHAPTVYGLGFVFGAVGGVIGGVVGHLMRPRDD